ncbi:MAG: hypothetical protein GYB67_09060 [Chloroflexi bacterium]|nr:hypothetical protein [Chloroflexota bacterium]
MTDDESVHLRVRAQTSQQLPNRALPPTYRLWLPLIPILLAALLLRGFSFFERVYPTGADYGHHLLYAELFLTQGRLPTAVPFFQLGTTEWSVLPGGSLSYALGELFSGTPVFELAATTLIYSLIETTGVYLLAWRLFRRLDAALTAALLIVLFPAGVDIVAWSGYPNLIALAFIPFALIAWLDYWHAPSWRSLLLTIVIVVGMMSVHHLSTLWMGLTFALFAALHLILRPYSSLRKLIPLGVVGVIAGLPVVLQILDLTAITQAAGVLLSADRFDDSRVTWSIWTQTASAVSLVFISGGVIALLRHRVIPLSDRLMILCYLVVCGLFAFGWIVGLRFYYLRALFFFPLIFALGAAALFWLWRPLWLRSLVVVLVITNIGFGSLLRTEEVNTYYTTLTPRVLEGVEWLRQYSEPGDVVVVGTFLGFQMSRLLNRPTLVALTPELVGNPQELETAADAVAILMGLENMDAIINERDVRYIIVKANAPDIPDAARAQLVMDANPRIRLLYRNRDLLIYEVLSS